MIMYKVKSAIHMIAGFVSAFHGYVLFIDSNNEYAFFYLIAGIFFIAISVTSKDVQSGFFFNGGIFFLLESIVFSLIAQYDFIGRSNLPGYIHAVLSVLYFGFAMFCIRRKHINKNGTNAIHNPFKKQKRM